MKKTLLTLGLLAAMGAAQAQSQGYLVGSVGASRYNIDCSGAPRCDKGGTAFKVMGGFRFSPTMSAELGYMDFGKATVSDSTAKLGLRASGLGGGLAVRADVSPQWSFTARLGLVQMKTELDASVVGFGSGSDSDTNATLYGGLSLGYKLAPNMTLDLGYDASDAKYKKNGLNETGGVGAFTVGITVDF